MDKPTSPPGDGLYTPPIRRTSRSFIELPVSAVHRSPRRQRHSAREICSPVLTPLDNAEPLSPTPKLVHEFSRPVSPTSSPPQPLSRRSVQDFGGAISSVPDSRKKRHSAREFGDKTRCINISKAPAEPLHHTTDTVKRGSLTRSTAARLRSSFRRSFRRDRKDEHSKSNMNVRPRMRSFQRRLFNRAADLAELELDPANRVLAYMAAADAAVDLGHLDSAEHHLKKALTNAGRETPHYVKAECFALLGILAERAGRIDDAEKFCKESLKLSGDVQSYVPIFVLGTIYNRAGRLDEAHVVLQYGEKYRKFIVE